LIVPWEVFEPTKVESIEIEIIRMLFRCSQKSIHPENRLRIWEWFVRYRRYIFRTQLCIRTQFVNLFCNILHDLKLIRYSFIKWLTLHAMISRFSFRAHRQSSWFTVYNGWLYITYLYNWMLISTRSYQTESPGPNINSKNWPCAQSVIVLQFRLHRKKVWTFRHRNMFLLLKLICSLYSKLGFAFWSRGC
jgi:hypothetical protein